MRLGGLERRRWQSPGAREHGPPPRSASGRALGQEIQQTKTGDYPDEMDSDRSPCLQPNHFAYWTSELADSWDQTMGTRLASRFGPFLLKNAPQLKQFVSISWSLGSLILKNLILGFSKRNKRFLVFWQWEKLPITRLHKGNQSLGGKIFLEKKS